MLFDFILQFMLELIRALLVDELARRVRALPRRRHPLGAALAVVQKRTRARLLNRLLTEIRRDL